MEIPGNVYYISLIKSHIMQLNVLHPAITFQEKTDTFSVELSDIDHTYPELYRVVSKGDPIDLHNPKTGGG